MAYLIKWFRSVILLCNYSLRVYGRSKAGGLIYSTSYSRKRFITFGLFYFYFYFLRYSKRFEVANSGPTNNFLPKIYYNFTFVVGLNISVDALFFLRSSISGVCLK